MRDQSRIRKYCDILAKCWEKVPDWRFGQFVSNVLGAYVSDTHRDIFFPEDDEVFAYIEQYFTEEGNKNG